MNQKRSAIYLVVLVGLIAGFITGVRFFFNMAYAFIALLLISFLWAWSGVNWLRLARQTRARRAQMGSFMRERFTLTNTGMLPKLWVEVYDESNLPGHRASHVASSIGPRSDATWMVRTRCIQRGEFELGPLRVVTGDPFGLFEVERQIKATSKMIVYPMTVDIRQFALPMGLLPGGDAIRRRTHQVTTNAAGVRDYVPGDSFNRIHWKSSARRDKLIVKEFELDPLADIWLIMDADRTYHIGEYHPELPENQLLWDKASAIPPTTEEYAVTVTASLARFFLQQNRSVGLATNAQQYQSIQVDRGPRQLTKIMETLALVRAEGMMPLRQLLSLEGNLMTRGTTVVITTPSLDERWVSGAQMLLQRGLRVIAVLIDPHSFGGRRGMEAIRAQLQGLGVPAYLVKRGNDLRAILEARR